MTVSLLATDPWDPYVRVPGGIRPGDVDSNVISALLSQRAVEQAESMLRAVDSGETEEGRFPLILRSLDQETGGMLTRRIANMMAAYQRLLTAPEHADVREKLRSAFRPLGAWIRGQFAVTSPVLMVFQSILLSHCEWFHEEPFEAYSAARAYNELESQGLPEAHRRFVAAIVSHQTLLRAAWSADPTNDPKEVLAFYEDEDGHMCYAEDLYKDDKARNEEWSDRATGQAISHTLFPFVNETDGDLIKFGDHPFERKRQLTAALVLHSLCLQCRHQRKESSTFALIKKPALRFLDHILDADMPSRFEHRLVFLQYGRYVYAVNDTLFEAAKNEVLEQAKNKKRAKNKNVSFCFQRVPTKHVWKGLTFDKQHAKQIPVSGNQGEIWNLIKPSIGTLVSYRLGETDLLEAGLGLG